MLGKHFAFEIVIGANGQFVINSTKAMDVIKLGNMILDAQAYKDNLQLGQSWLQNKIKEYARAQ